MLGRAWSLIVVWAEAHSLIAVNSILGRDTMVCSGISLPDYLVNPLEEWRISLERGKESGRFPSSYYEAGRLQSLGDSDFPQWGSGAKSELHNTRIGKKMMYFD
jgi:hypothetical protein